MSQRAFVVGAGLVSAHGVEYEGVSRALERRELVPKSVSRAPGPELLACPVPELPLAQTPEAERARRLMSRSALFTTFAGERALTSAAWFGDAASVGMFMGVGASGGAMDQLEAMLRASLVDGEFSLTRFGSEGLGAASPLFAFQLMNNFTLCHGAIEHGTQGPNAAFFSRGAGTWLALDEACHALAAGDTERVLVGGADTALHPVTLAELAREGKLEAGLIPGEAAALLALAAHPGERVLATLESAALERFREGSLARLLDKIIEPLAARPPNAIVIAPSTELERRTFERWLTERQPTLPVLDVTRGLGHALAAAPAVAWVVGLDVLCQRALERVWVMSAGSDDSLGVLSLAKGLVA